MLSKQERNQAQKSAGASALAREPAGRVKAAGELEFVAIVANSLRATQPVARGSDNSLARRHSVLPARFLFSFSGESNGTAQHSTAQHFTDKLTESVEKESSLNISASERAQMLENIQRLKNTKVHILITGATGCGKSSTINALFDMEKAKVGQGVDPETMDIARYDLDNIVLFDSPGLGDGKTKDEEHAKRIADKLLEKDGENNYLIDLVLVILEGGSRDLGTSYTLINDVIIPSLGKDKSRLLVAINQADMAMKGRHWNYEENRPEPELVKFLNEKVESTKRRIYEATGVDADVIYYAAGYKDGDKQQHPYNLAKLLSHILHHIKHEKRAVVAQDINRNPKPWGGNDGLKDYINDIKEAIENSVLANLVKGIGSLAGAAIAGVIGGVGSLVSGAASVIGSVASSVGSWFGSWFD